MRRAALVIALAVAIAAIVIWRLRTRGADPPAPPAEAGAASSSPGSAAPPRDRHEPAKHVRRLEPAQRAQLAAQIAAARERARGARGAPDGTNRGGGTAGGDDTITVEQVSGSVKTALEEAIPLLAACYGDDAKAGKTAAVQMVMYSDPAVGTVIDTDAMTDRDGQPLPAKLDDCLRTTIETLELPPLEVGGRLPLQYSFVFD